MCYCVMFFSIRVAVVVVVAVYQSCFVFTNTSGNDL